MARHLLPRWTRIPIVAGLLPAVAGCASGAVHQKNEAGRIAVSAEGSRSIAGAAGNETTTRSVDLVSHADRPQGVSWAPGGDAVVRVATRYVGTAYVWGGTRPSGFDCSGFVKYIYAKLGVPLPRTVRDQYTIGTAVSRDRLLAGDIVFFDRLRHNGVYIGNGRLIHASSTGGAVMIAKLDEKWFKQRWVGARRLASALDLKPPLGPPDPHGEARLRVLMLDPLVLDLPRELEIPPRLYRSLAAVAGPSLLRPT